MKKTGFTMVELLAVIAILAILSGVAIPAVSSYLKKSRRAAYKTIKLNACDALQNYIMTENIICMIPASNKNNPENNNCAVTFQTLMNKGYLETQKDPANDSQTCSGTVYVSNETSGGDKIVTTYDMRVDLNCTSKVENNWKCENIDE